MGLRSLYFMLADMHARFSYLQQGLATILAFVGVKMIISPWYDIPTAVSLLVIVIVLIASVSFSLQRTRHDRIEVVEDSPPPDER
jgi:tellurite resistance protein TerC